MIYDIFFFAVYHPLMRSFIDVSGHSLKNVGCTLTLLSSPGGQADEDQHLYHNGFKVEQMVEWTGSYEFAFRYQD